MIRDVLKYLKFNSFFFFFSSRRRHTRYWRDWSSDVCSSDLGCDVRRISCHRQGRTLLHREGPAHDPLEACAMALSGATATFRLSSGDDLVLVVALHQAPGSTLAADIAFRFLQRLALATAERLERLLEERTAPGADQAVGAPKATSHDEIRMTNDER